MGAHEEKGKETLLWLQLLQQQLLLWLLLWLLLSTEVHAINAKAKES